MVVEDSHKMLKTPGYNAAGVNAQSRSRYSSEQMQPHVQEVLDEAFIKPKPTPSTDVALPRSKTFTCSTIPKCRKTMDWFSIAFGETESSKCRKRTRSCEFHFNATESAMQHGGF